MKDPKDNSYQPNDNQSNNKPNPDNPKKHGVLVADDEQSIANQPDKSPETIDPNEENKKHGVLVAEEPESDGKPNRNLQNKKVSDTPAESQDTDIKATDTDKQKVN